MKVNSCLYCGAKKLTKVTYRSDNNGILKCPKCGVMMVEHINGDTESLYTSDYFEKDKGTKNGYTNYLSSPVGNLIGKYAFARLFVEKGNQLDLGCADGSLMEIFKSEGFESRGLEISKDAVQIANSKGLNVEFSNLHSFPEQLSKSDVITAYDLLEHADMPGAVLRDVYSNLNDNGCFVFSTLSVKHNDPSDYWFNNSLEHYVYYNAESLQYILTDIFGENNFAFVEMDVNGVAEFWGVAKKGALTDEGEIIKTIVNRSFNKKDADQGYYLSLFYNQVSEFEISRQISVHFDTLWSTERRVVSRFFNNFYQGKLEAALNDSKMNKHAIPVSNSVYWQAAGNAEEMMTRIRIEAMSKESSNEILGLRAQVFDLTSEIHSIRGSRVVGRIIKARDRIVPAISKAVRAPRHVYNRSLYFSKEAVIAVIPEESTERIKAMKKKIKNSVKKVKDKQGEKKIVVLSGKQSKLRGGPLLSVVIPYFNRAETIDETLISLKNQTFKNFEVIIVNDGSTEKQSKDVFKKLPQKYSQLKINLIDQENAGVAVARNEGIEHANAKYILCLDSDDALEETYIEKALLVLESTPSISVFTTDREDFGVRNDRHANADYNALRLYKDNMVITAAVFTKEAWVKAGGFKSGISYEDWDFWLSLAENGYWGKSLHEPLFKYRVAMNSRFVEDRSMHWDAIKKITSLHGDYKKKIRALSPKKQDIVVRTPTDAFVNMNHANDYDQNASGIPHVLIAIPWMTFGGAETLLYNYTRELVGKVDITFMTGVASKHEWEYKFREVTNKIYHLPEMFPDPALYIEFISLYIQTRSIDILHIVHSGYVFDMLPELKRRHPQLKVLVTMFNDRVPEYVQKTIEQRELIDTLNTDSSAVADSYREKTEGAIEVLSIPNGIDCKNEFNPQMFDRDAVRKELKIESGTQAVFFVGRLSSEKNPDVFVRVAQLAKEARLKNVKFFIIGDGPMHDEVVDGIYKNKISNTYYLGYQKEVARYLVAADIFVLPSSVEGFPLSILEAMAMNVAVISSRVGAVPDVLQDGVNGYTVTPGDAKEIYDCIVTLQDEKLLKTIQKNGRKDVETKYSNTRLGNSYRDLYIRSMK